MREWQADDTRPTDLPLPGETAAASDSCPGLDSVLNELKQIDLATARVVQTLGHLQDTGEVENTTGVPLELWLSQMARLIRADRRMLQTAATVLRHMPSTMAAWLRGHLAWGQVRGVVLRVRQLPKRTWFAIDTALAADMDTFADADPDELLRQVDLAVAELLSDREERDHESAVRGRFLSIQPSLLGEYDGRIYGEGPNEALAAIADGLDRLIPPPGASPRSGPGADADLDHESMVSQGRRRFDALLWLFATHPTLAGRDNVSTVADLPDGWDGPAELIAASKTPLHLTVTCDIETLLELANRPGGIVTTLSGGQLRATAALCRRLADAGGSLRLLVVDDHGQVLGAGKRTRVPPDWLAEAVRTMWPTSIAPNTRTSARHCDIDHHEEWQHGGATTIDNLAPLDRRFHSAKSKGEWTIRPGPDGTRIVSHPRSGWSQTVIPATRRIDLHGAVRR